MAFKETAPEWADYRAMKKSASSVKKNWEYYFEPKIKELKEKEEAYSQTLREFGAVADVMSKYKELFVETHADEDYMRMADWAEEKDLELGAIRGNIIQQIDEFIVAANNGIKSVKEMIEFLNDFKEFAENKPAE